MKDRTTSRAALRAAVGIACAGVVVSAASAVTKTLVHDNLYGTKFLTAQEGWIVGAFGVIFHTVDGGKVWQPQKSQTVEQLFSVDFADAKRGWIVGRSGTILHTSDGGATWTKQVSNTDKHLFSVDFVDADTGIAVGDWGAVLLTSDGGKTWREQSLTEDVILNDVQMLDRSRGWVVGELGTVLTTEDGGVTWNERKTGADKTLFGVHFVDANNGWLSGLDGLIIQTTDGGQNWQVLHGTSEVSELEQVEFSASVENPSLYAIHVGDGRGYAVGEAGAIFASADAGKSWQRQPTPADWGLSWLRDLSVVTGSSGFIVGAEGRRVPIVNGQIELTRED